MNPVRRGRIAACLLFGLFGVALGAWTVRIPAIKHGLGLSDGQLGIALLGIAAGAIAGMQVVGLLIDRFGSVRVMVPAGLAEGAALIPSAYAPTLAWLTVALFGFGVVHGTLNIAMNANAVEVERARGRPTMSSFHAVYSIGGFAGAALGGIFAHVGLTAATTFAVVAVAGAVAAGWAGRWALDAGAAGSASEARSGAGSGSGAASGSGAEAGSGATARVLPGARRRPTGVLFLGVLVFSCLVGEGAAADWSAVYLRDSLGSSAGFAAAAYASFAVLMTAGRLVGDRLAATLGPVRLVRGSGLLAAGGLGAALLVDHPLAGVLGFACLGAGLSCIAPQVFSAAGNRDPARAGQAIARVASLGYLGFLVGPVLIGGVATVTGLPVALAIPALLALFVALSAPALRRRAPVATA